MSEQRYEISTPLPSIDFLEEYNNEISSNDEFECEMLNETLDNTSDIHFEDPEKKKKNDCETFEHDEVIDNLEHTKLTPCVVIDFIKGEVQRCGESTKLRQLQNLFGTWQVDRDAINEVDGVLIRLGVCNTHFQFDNKYLHQSRNKQLKDFNQGIIQWRRCISCNKYITFYSRGAGCTLHSWHLNKQNIQVPCIGQYTCEALRDCLPVCKRAFDDINPRQKSVCCWCYKNLGGHIYHRPGRGKSGTTCTTLHTDDTAKGLEYLGNWLINIAQTGNDKEKILTKVFEALLPFADLTFSSNSTITTLISTTLNEPPSLFMIKTLFIEFSKKQEIEKKLEIKEKELEKKEIEKKEIEKKLEIEDLRQEFGRTFGQKLWNSRSYVNSRAAALESPQTIQEYYDGFPEFLNDFFFGVIDELYQKKMTLLTVCHVSSHSDRHERKLAKTRMEESNPSNRLIRANNVWNLAIIDNIDFKEKSFKFGNIYDVTRGNSHATLRMAFQAQLPVKIETSPKQVIELTANTSLFGMNQSIDETLNMFQKVIFDLLDFKEIEGELIYKTNFDAETIKRVLLTKLEPGCLGPSPNVVILEPGANPNSDEEILHVTEMYKEDFAMNNHSFLDIIADEAIFRRLIKCREKWPNIRPHLGQWHTSKDFCSVLIVLFSSYGLLSLASRLGVRFLDKFEAAVDYRSTARVLDLLWVAVGIAINIYIKKIGISLSDIMDDENDAYVCLKIWYLYYKWAGIWKVHRMGIRIGNFGLQRNSLSAAAPLYASAAKSNYTTAIAHYLSIIAAHPKLEERLNYCSAFKIPRDVNEDSRHVCFGFDEALETFGVRFVKQNVYGNIIDEKNLRDQIKSSQDERERIDLLMSKYLNDYAVSYSEQAIKSRKESLWELVNDLITVFGMSDPLSHQLFQEYTPTEMHKEGLSRLFDCYPNGLERIKAVYRQEVLKTKDRNPQGRRTIGVVRTKVKDYNTGARHRTTEDETAILCALKIYKNYLPEDAIGSVREKLSEVWTVKKVREWWNYHKNKEL
ncbi:hypothetical protein GLOIN_2v1482460 [Rhizophagus clarus]|uniref:Uncharacterized protein n=1 Tax=Rhizophagus clarus TaxID=94130 RepID=A0A8H3QJ31_9GLOM|nr:hypothetical protein GLOIN_2v1482460 [Rhizophagus clarus]